MAPHHQSAYEFTKETVFPVLKTPRNRRRKVQSREQILSEEPLVLKPIYVPFLAKSLNYFVLAVVILVARSIVPALPELVSLIVNVASGVFALLGLVALIIGTVRRNSYTYTLNSEGIVISRELFSRNMRRIPYAAISDIEVHQGIAGRIFNYGDIVPITKSGFGLATDERYSGETYVTELTNAPNPSEVARWISDRISPAGS